MKGKIYNRVGNLAEWAKKLQLLNPDHDLAIKYLVQNEDSISILYKRKSHQIFSHKSNMFLHYGRVGKTHGNQ